MRERDEKTIFPMLSYEYNEATINRQKVFSQENLNRDPMRNSVQQWAERVVKI